MVRSLGPASSSDSRELSSLLDSGSEHSETPEEAAARARAEEAQQERRRQNTREWLRRRMVSILCELTLESGWTKAGYSSRQVSGRRSSHNRRCQGHSLDGVLTFTLPQLEARQADELRNDVELILQQYDEPVPPNDLVWIYSDQVGRAQDPQRHHVEQALQHLLLRSLAPRLHTRTAPDLIKRIILAAGGCLYRDSLMLVWPLLSSEDRYLFQQWYQGSPAAPLDNRAMEWDAPEPARGSRDPAPPS